MSAWDRAVAAVRGKAGLPAGVSGYQPLALTGTGWAPSLTPAGPADWRSSDTYTGQAVTADRALALSAVWACINLLAGTISSLPLMVYRTDPGGARTVARDHPLYRVLHDAPNYDQTAVDFWGFGVASIELRGSLHARVERGSRGVAALLPIGPQVVARRVEDGSIRYRWNEGGRTWDEPQENIFHVRGFGGSPLGGLSTLAYGRQAFGVAMAIETAAGATFRNGLRPGHQITFDKFLTDDQRAMVQGIISKYRGAVNSGDPFVGEGGMKLEALSINPEDAQMLESRGFSVEEICRFFGVPPFMIAHNDKASGYPTSLEAQVLTFQKFTLRQRLKRIEQAAEQQLLTPADRAAGITVEFNLEGLLRGDSTGRAAFYQSGLSNGWMTINEVRALENMPPVSGGDVPRMQIQNVPITEAGKVSAVAPPTPA